MNINGKAGIRQSINTNNHAKILNGLNPFHLSGVPFNNFQSHKTAIYAIDIQLDVKVFVNAFHRNILLGLSSKSGHFQYMLSIH